TAIVLVWKPTFKDNQRLALLPRRRDAGRGTGLGYGPVTASSARPITTGTAETTSHTCRHHTEYSWFSDTRPARAGAHFRQPTRTVNHSFHAQHACNGAVTG